MPSFQSLLLIGGLVLLAAFLIFKLAAPKPIANIPYNKEALQSFLGDFPSFQKWHVQRPELYTWMVAQSEKLNSPVIQLFMRPLSKPWVVVADFKEAEDIMTRRHKEFGRAAVVGDFFAPLLPHWHTHMPTGSEWRTHRSLVGDSMSPAFLSGVAGPQIYDTALDTIQLWKEKSRLALGKPFSAFDDVHHSTLDAIWAAAFGSQIGTVRSQISALAPLKSLPSQSDAARPYVSFPEAMTPATFNSIITLTHSVEIAIKSPFPRLHLYLALKLLPKLRSAMKHKDRLIGEHLQDSWRRLSKSGSSGNGFKGISSAADLFVQKEIMFAKKEGRNAQFDSPAIRDELFGFLVAGHDTTSITICWGLKLLTAHQNVQDELRASLRSYFARAMSSGELPTAQEIIKADIPFLDATIQEIHRLGGTVSANVRQALCDTQILGYHVPKGTDVFLLSQGPSYTSSGTAVDEKIRAAPSHLKVHYGTWDSLTISEFLPQRWLVSDAGSTSGFRFNPFAGPAHPFGAGPRGCFGRKLATMELKIILTSIIWSFILQTTPEELSSFAGHDVNTHIPQQCYVKLSNAN